MGFITSPFQSQIGPPYLSTKWYLPIGVTIQIGVAGQDTIQFGIFNIFRPITISDLGTRITTALAANNVQLAIYANGSNNRPTGNPLAVTGDLSTAVAATVSGDIVGANVTLQPGTYWSAINHSGATSVAIGCNGGTSGNPGFGGLPAFIGSAALSSIMSSSTTASMRYTFAQVYNTWPDMTANVPTENVGSAAPTLAFKVA